MANRAILLIEAALGKSTEVVSLLRTMSWVRSADRVTPPYDVIAFVELDSPKEMTDEIQANLRGAAGITGMIVCPVCAPLVEGAISEDRPKMRSGG